MNWGKGIIIAFVLFISFIVSMVYIAFTRDADLVRDDYYENELAFDETKEKRQNFKNSGYNINIEQMESGVVISFPDELKTQNGRIIFYRPDKKKYDKEFDLNLNEQNEQVLEYEHFKEGYYDLSIEWSDGKRSYLFEDSISFS